MARQASGADAEETSMPRYTLSPRTGGAVACCLAAGLSLVGPALVVTSAQASAAPVVSAPVVSTSSTSTTSTSTTSTPIAPVVAASGAIAAAPLPDGKGFWTVTSAGVVSAYGAAASLGDLAGRTLNAPVVGIAATPDGNGYWLVASDGGIFSFGDATFHGSTGNLHLNQPIVGMAATPTGNGYWLVASDGGIFSFGDATFHGSTGNLHLNQPIVGMAATPTGNGYWLVASDGGIFTFGDATYLGSLANAGQQVVSMTCDKGSAGYIVVTAVGGISTLPGADAAQGESASPTSTASGGISAQTTAPVTPPVTPVSPVTPVTGRIVPAGINLGGSANSTFASLSTTEQNSELDQITTTGFSWIRIDIPFDGEMQENGQFDWSATTEVEQAVAHGLHVDALLSYAPSWADLADGTPNPSLFAAFAQAAVAHYGPLGVSTWEVYNEPNLVANWGTAVSPSEYTSVLKATYSAIKSVQPSSTVVSGGLAPAVDASNGSQMSPLTFLADMYKDGAEGSFDAFGIHPYSYPDMPMDPDSWNTFYELPNMHALMAANGDGAKAIWATEFGAPTSGLGAVSDTAQADMISQAYAAADQWSWMGPLFLFDWQDNSADGGFGITQSNGIPKPAAAMVTASRISPAT
jgi:hypothetical protein